MTLERKWVLEDHLCKSCGGRILRCVENNGMTPGGNPFFKCAQCGKIASGMSTDVLCWCGFHHRMNHKTAYRCVAFSELESNQDLLQLFLACGCDPKRGGEVGIVLEKNLRELYCKDL